MSPALIAQLIIALGPTAIDVIRKLVAVWQKPTLTPEEVNTICDAYVNIGYEEYIAKAGGRPTK